MQDLSVLVNGHFLRHLMTLAAVEDVNASEDVYSAQGVKLIGKGSKISESMYERIVSHKLRKPLESSIEVGEPIQSQHLVSAAEALLDASPALARMVAHKGTRGDAMNLLKRISYGSQLGALLKLYQSRMPNVISHSVLVALLAAGILRRMDVSQASMLETMLMAGICHDIGDLYIDPELYAERSTPLTPQEWRQMAAHPAIGHTALKGVGGLAPAVADLVLEHHERMDGGGYPRGLGGVKVSREGHVLAVAEALSQFIGRHNEPFSYAEIALKILPGEFSTEVIDVVARCRDELQASLAPATGSAPAQFDKPAPSAEKLQSSMKALFIKIGKVCEVLDNVADKAGGFSAEAKTLHASVCMRFERITRAISSSGLDIVHDGVTYENADAHELAKIHLEFDATVSEVSWRMMELAKQIILQSANFAEHEHGAFAMLAEALGATLKI